MTETEYIFICILIAGVFAVCVTTLVLVNGTQQMLLDFKKEFRRFRDKEQYECHLENNPIVGVKLNLDGSWSEVREKDKWYTDPITKAGDTKAGDAE